MSINYILRYFLLLFMPVMLGAQDSKTSWFDELHQDKIVSVVVYTKMDSLLSSNYNLGEYPAEFFFKDGPLKGQSWDVKLSQRGKFRRRICDFPPLKMTVSKKQLKKEELRRKYNDYKLVTHCLDDKSAKVHIMKEYLAYRIYNLLSPSSFRVQLLQIDYHDTHGYQHIKKQFGILIEDEDQMAKRINGKVRDTLNLQTNSFQRMNVNVHALFQYMIGNSDWSIIQNRNCKLVELEEEASFVVVPYDFDFSGLVEASYAIPNVDYEHTSITDRIFLGDASDEDMEDCKQQFLEQQNIIIDYCKRFHHLKKRERKRIGRYLDGFFEELESGSLCYPDDL